MRAEGESNGRGRTAWIGYLVAAACLIWVVHDIRWSELLGHMLAMSGWLLIPAVASDIGSYVSQGVRWSLLTRPMGRLTASQATQAIYAGLFTNEVLPLRMGEVVRGYLVTRWTPIPVTGVLSSMLVERFLDGVWMVLAVGVVVLTVPLPDYLVDAEDLLAAGIFVAAALFVVMVLWRSGPAEPAAPPGDVRQSRLRHWLSTVMEAIRQIGGSRWFFVAAAMSALLLALQVVSFWLVMEAYHLRLSLWQGAAVFLIVHLGTMTPGAPSNVGTYQFFTVVGLSLFGVDKTLATGFSFVVFLILTFPLWAIGLWAFGRAGLTLSSVRQQISDLARAMTSPPG